MKIPDKDPNHLLESTLLGSQRGVNEVKQQDASKPHSAQQSSAPDSVDISEQARTLQQLTQLVSTETNVRMDRVEEIQKAIAAGTYEPDVKETAEKLLRSTLLDNIL